MNKSIIFLITALIVISGIAAMSVEIQAASSKSWDVASTPLKTEAFNILENKCNVCHRKQNPFMVFNLKNMEKRAKKINKNVFELQRMPKGDEIKLTSEERETLKNWIQSLNIK
jgi:uncharacterized membrane protein